MKWTNKEDKLLRKAASKSTTTFMDKINLSLETNRSFDAIEHRLKKFRREMK